MIVERIAQAIGLRSLENPRVPLSADAWDEAGLLSGKSDAGVRVSHASALTFPPVFQAISLISGDVAKLPLEVFRRVEGDGREADRRHRAYRLVRRKANREMPAFRFWRLMMARALLWNNAYAFIDRNGAGEPLELIPLLPDRTAPERIRGELWYATEVGRGSKSSIRWIPAFDVFHLQGVAIDDLVGCDLVEAARSAFGLGLARQKFAARFFKNGMRVSGVIQAPPGSTKQQRDKVAAGVEKAHTGLDAAHKVLVLRDNFRFIQTTIAPGEAQMLEGARESVKDVARYFNIPPHKLADSSNTSHNSLEQENQSYLDSTLSPWLCAITSEGETKLLSEEEQAAETHYLEHNTAALLRTDTKTRFEVYKVGIESGFLSADEARAKENLNKRPDGKGGEYLRPLNMAPAGEDPDDQAGDDSDDQAGRAGELGAAARAVVEDTLGRIVKRLALHARKASKRPADWARWLEAFAGEHRDVCARMLEPAAAIAAAATGRRVEILDSLFTAIRGDLANKTRGVPGEDLEQVVADICDAYEATAAGEFADRFFINSEDK